jgi:hypothetical protein
MIKHVKISLLYNQLAILKDDLSVLKLEILKYCKRLPKDNSFILKL